MKTITIRIFFILTGVLLATVTFSQTNRAGDILGTWLNEDQDAHVEIYEQGGRYFGKIIWLKFPIDDETGKPKVDDENPDPALQNRPVMGLNILKDFVFDGDSEWEDGSIYDPKNGKTYDCYMAFEDTNLLKIRGFIGITLLGRTTYWTRVIQ
jgi:uncharacterized protein (DUF2147 family)